MSNPEIVSELRRIAAEHRGILKPSDVVESARPKSSPLHSRFEWDDTEAAERYRLWQARQLIAVTVEYIGSGDDAILSKVFVSLTSDRKEGGGYRGVVSVMSDRERNQEMLQDALEEMERFQKKFAEVKQLSEVFAAMRKVKTKTQPKRRRQPEMSLT